jgi:hypothetical protein
MNDKYLPDIYTFLEEVMKYPQIKIKFIKRDSTIRIMNCTLDFKQIPKIHQPKNINVPNIIQSMRKKKIIRMYDLDKNAWRSVPYDRVEWVDFIEFNERKTPIPKRYYKKIK